MKCLASAEKDIEDIERPDRKGYYMLFDCLSTPVCDDVVEGGVASMKWEVHQKLVDWIKQRPCIPTKVHKDGE